MPKLRKETESPRTNKNNNVNPKIDVKDDKPESVTVRLNAVVI